MVCRLLVNVQVRGRGRRLKCVWTPTKCLLVMIEPGPTAVRSWSNSPTAPGELGVVADLTRDGERRGMAAPVFAAAVAVVADLPSARQFRVRAPRPAGLGRRSQLRSVLGRRRLAGAPGGRTERMFTSACDQGGLVRRTPDQIVPVGRRSTAVRPPRHPGVVVDHRTSPPPQRRRRRPRESDSVQP